MLETPVIDAIYLEANFTHFKDLLNFIPHIHRPPSTHEPGEQCQSLPFGWKILLIFCTTLQITSFLAPHITAMVYLLLEWASKLLSDMV